jgi:type VI secretion system secreted protein VgrG
MPSVVTGVVQPGPNGEVGGVPEIDSEGRYRVQMHFDGGAALRPASSHPMRMAQAFAGNGHGQHFPLSPGTEVLVAFANGDPDRPVILGALPNPTSRSPVVDTNPHFHRTVSPGGLTVEFGTSIRK